MYNAVKQNQTEHDVYHSRSTFFSQNLFYKWKCTNKQNHNVQDVTPWAHNGGRSPVLQGKGKVCVGRLQTLCFQRSVSTFTFPIRSLFLLHISTRVHSDTHTSQVSAIYASARIQLHEHNCPQRTPYIGRCSELEHQFCMNRKVGPVFFGGKSIFSAIFGFTFKVWPCVPLAVVFKHSSRLKAAVCVCLQSMPKLGECGCVNTVGFFMCAAIFTPDELPALSFRSGLWHQRSRLIKESQTIIRTTAEMRLGQQSGLCLSAPVLTGYVRIRSPATKTNQIRQAYFLPMTHRSLTDKLLQKYTF